MIEGFDLVTQLFHMGERTSLDMSRPVPQITDASQLANVGIVGKFESLVQEIIKTDDCEVALLGRRVIEDILLHQSPQMRQNSPQIYERYQKLILLLKFMNIYIYGLGEIANIVKTGLVAAMKAGINVKIKFQRILDDFDDVLLEGEIAETLGRAMTLGEEKIGENSLIDDQKKVSAQTLGNWLKDYIEKSLSGPEGSTGSFERIQYFKFNPNTAKLSKADQQLLLYLFRLYDWLRYGNRVVVEEENTVSVGGTTYMQSGHYGVSEIQKSISDQPSPPVPRNAPTLRPISEITPAKPAAPALRLGENRKLEAGRPEAEKLGDQKIYRNEKAAQLRAASGLEPILNSGTLTVNNSIAGSKDLSTPQQGSGSLSGGPDGNRTRETELSRSRSAPAPAQPQQLYQSKIDKTNGRDMTDRTNKPANIQDLLRGRGSQSDAGLRMSNQASQNLKPASPPPPLPASSEELKAAYINKKLEELKKKSKEN